MQLEKLMLYQKYRYTLTFLISVHEPAPWWSRAPHRILYYDIHTVANGEIIELLPPNQKETRFGQLQITALDL
jgi:hypothetical protein